jgi:uncharacterized protein
METYVLTQPSAASAAEVASTLSPVAEAERISSIDVMRGVALLGIALMNVVFSGLPFAADWNPKVGGGATGLNLGAFFLQYVLFDGKMRGLFSMMFGASTYLLIGRLDGRGAGLRAAEIYYRRILWLMLIGLVHAYLIWHGDILYPYALLGLVLLPLLRVRPRNLLITAEVMLLLMTAGDVGKGFYIRTTHDGAMQADKADAARKPLTDDQKAARTEWQEIGKYFSPSAEDLRKEKAVYSGSYFNLVAKRAVILFKEWHAMPFYLDNWDMFTMMLVGIAFIKTGVLGAERSFVFYWRLLAVSYGISLPIGAFAAWKSWQQGFEPMQTVFTFSTYQLGRVGMTLGHAALILLLCKYGVWPAMRARLAAVGKTALSNYIAHSLIYGLVFCGYGFNLFDKLQRYQLYYVVLGMWIFSLVWSPIWLQHFRFGPLEWVWRSLTYWKRQPMLISQPVCRIMNPVALTEPRP